MNDVLTTGSKFLQVNYKMDVVLADTYMLLPEGCMVVISPLFGYYLDKSQLPLRQKLLGSTASCFLLSTAYLLLAFGFTPNDSRDSSVSVSVDPLISMGLLGECRMQGVLM